MIARSADLRRRRSWAGALAVGAALALALGGCTLTGGNDTDAAPTSGPPSSSGQVARVAVLTSDRGPLELPGREVRAAVDLALAEATEAGTVPGWSFEAVDVTDRGTQSSGQQAAASVTATENLIGVVGSLSSTIDEGVQPILNNAGITMISPGGTAESLTRRIDGTQVIRPFETYFRVAATDGDLGPSAAVFMDRELGLRRVALVDDGSSYGRLLVAGFDRTWRAEGGRKPFARTLALPADSAPDPTAAPEGDAPDAAELADERREAVARAVAGSGAQAVFLGGSAESAEEFEAALEAIGSDLPLVGGQTLLGSAFEPEGGSASSDGASPSPSTSPAVAGREVYAVFPGAPASVLPNGGDFRAAFEAAGAGTDPGPYAVAAYEAALTLVDAFGDVIGTSPRVSPLIRAAVADAVGQFPVLGPSGPVRFDSLGDRREPPLAVYRRVGADWLVVGPVGPPS